MPLRGVKSGDNLIGYSLDFKDVSEQLKLLKQYDNITDKWLRLAMHQSVITLHSAIVPLTPVGVTGNLRKTMKTEVKGFGSEIVGRVGSTMKKEEYPAVMEFGRRKGAKMPPPSALYRWVEIVLKVPKKKVPGVAYIVARAIGKKGIKGRRFMQKGYRKSKPRIEKFFAVALGRITEDLSIGN